MTVYTVEVYAAGMLMDVQHFSSEDSAQLFADNKQDEGYKVRFIDAV